MFISKQHGGGAGYTPGIPVNNIESFIPTNIPDIELWIKAETPFIKEETIQSYSNKQSYFVKEKLLEQFKNRLESKVITEIVSDTPDKANSLILLNIDTSVLTVFPTLRLIDGELDAINISNYNEPITGKVHKIQLITKRPVSMKDADSSYMISHGLTITQNLITKQIMLTPPTIIEPVVNPDTDVKYLDITHPNYSPLEANVVPTAEFSEIIVYSRTLTADENAQLEGYLAYKQNTQYALVAGHPYLPNMITDPLFNSYAQEFKRLNDELRQEVSSINVVVKEYVNEKGDDGIVRTASQYAEEVKQSLDKMNNIIQILSKGYLYARKRKELTLDMIFKNIKERAWSKDDISDSGISGFIRNCQDLKSRTTVFIEKISSSYSNRFVPKQQGGGSIAATFTSQITDHVLFTEQTEKSKILYGNLREKQKQIQSDGLSSYIRLQNKLRSDMSIYIDTALHKWSEIQDKHISLEKEIKDVESYILTGKWLEYLTNADKTTSANTPPLTEIKYNDPSLETINTYYTHIKTQMKSGDYAYILQEFKEIKTIIASFTSNPLNPVFRTTYTNFLQRQLKNGDGLFKEFIKAYTTFSKYLENINSFITVARETGEISVFDDKVDSTSYYKPLLNDIYIRKVIPLDNTLFGLEYVETTKDGFLVNTNVIPYFQTFGLIKTKTTPFLDENGINVVQNIHILNALSESVYKGLVVKEKPSLYTHTVESLYEIDRNQMDAIHCVETPLSVNPILLPSYVISKDSWCLIYNIGENPISVRTPENTVNIIGPNNGILYLYVDGETLYGSYSWTRNQLPYDTLLDFPRTNLSMYIDELGTSIYVRECSKNMYEPVYTSDGFLCEVLKAPDNYVYDIDDMYKSNPYLITNISKDKRENLLFNPKMKKMVKLPPSKFKICQDKTTGLAILLNENGMISVNEFGYVKAIRAPIQLIGDEYKIRGAYGDILLEPTINIFQSKYDIEPFFTFESVFSTRFASSIGNKYVFVTNSLYPIVSPNGTVIEVPPIVNSIPSFYMDDLGQHEVLVVKALDMNLQSSLYKRPIESDLSKLEIMRLKFKNAKDYILNEIVKVESDAKDIREFGTDTDDFFKESVDLFKKSFKDLETNNSIIESDVYPTPQAIDAMNDSIKKTLNSFFKTRQEVYINIKAYKDGIDEINNTKKIVEYWNTEGSKELDETMSKINNTINEAMVKTQNTVIDELDVMMKKCVELHAEFNDTLKMCVNYILTPPALISEVHSWCTYIKPKLDLLDSISGSIKLVYGVKLPNALKAYHTTNLYSKNATKIRDLYKDVQTRWATIHDKKMAIDTYIKLNPNILSPERYNEFEKNMVDGDKKMSDMYKRIKEESPTEQLYASIKELNDIVVSIQKSAPTV